MELRWVAAACAAACASVGPGAACAPPPGFIDLPVGSGWSQIVGVCCAPGGNGRLFVWEKPGRVWIVENGIRNPTPLIDITEEAGNYGDFGLLGFAVDPDFWSNGYIYLSYVVDYHHLRYFGTPDYNPAANQYMHDTIGRITRYTANSADGFRSVDYGSRLVLLGESMGTGVPILHLSHGAGALAFGQDGTLLAALGDGASYATTDTGGPISGSSNTALADGIITPKEDVGSFRAQMVDSLGGKIVRLDPATGDGVPSNPFFDPLAPRAARSRVWALGFRNPYRMGVRPGTGSPNPADGDPGDIFYGDVGWATWEETGVCTGPGQNFGWPLFEGLTPNGNYQAAGTLNQDAPNPLYGADGCGVPYYPFRDLCIQDTLDPGPVFPNPCGGAAPADSAPRFVHRRPLLEWKHGVAEARTGVYDGLLAAESVLGTPGCPVSGPPFAGNCATGGAWYGGTTFPAEYQNSYFFADFGAQWMKCMTFDAQGRPAEVRDFLPAGEAGRIVCITADPSGSGLFYIRLPASGPAQLRQVFYYDGTNLPPVAVGTATPGSGPVPLTVQFDASQSSDPENLPLAYEWDFGDGSPVSTEPNPVHVYTDANDVTNLGTVIAKIFSLNPPYPLGDGSPDPDVMRDNDLPPVGTTDPLRQYDTSHNGEQGLYDWIGYSFPQPFTFNSLLYQEGARDEVGGWWSGVLVQYYDGAAWQHATGVTCDPPFASGKNGPGFRTYRFTFTPVATTGLRLYGGIFQSKFVSVGELRTYTAGQGSGGPRCRTATLRVTDALGAQATAEVKISLDNTAPQVQIVSPENGQKYSLWRTFDVPLAAAVSDAEHGAPELECLWQVVVHHGDHTHLESSSAGCDGLGRVQPHGGDCPDYFYEFVLTVTDPACLSTTRSVFMYPNCCRPDFNNDGFVDGIDADLFNNAFESGDPGADYNADQFLDGVDYDQFMNDFEAGC